MKSPLLVEVNTMDDLQFRRSILADPKNLDDALKAAISEDPAKKKLSDDIAQLDDKLASAMKVDVPEDLYDKLILRQTLSSHKQAKRKSKIQYALAASVALVFGLSFQFLQFSSAYTNLGDHALAHVAHEEGHFDNSSSQRISLETLNKKMAAFKGEFSGSLGTLISADFCRFDGMKSLHLVFQGKTSPVTVFVVPDNEELAFTANFATDKLTGQSQHFEHTNIIVIGDKNESVQEWQNKINQKVQWHT